MSSNSWHVINKGDDEATSPCIRTGHTFSRLPGTKKAVLFGGANPSGSVYEKAHLFDGETMRWSSVKVEAACPPGRYDHAGAVVGTRLYIFAGADTVNSKNDMWYLDTETMEWHQVDMKGKVPSKRTLHSCAVVNNRIWVFGGGGTGSAAVDDTMMHCFDTKLEKWTAFSPVGDAPGARMGHSVDAVGDHILVFGGNSTDQFYNDTYIFSTGTLKWECMKAQPHEGGGPSPRTGHASTVHEQCVYVHGGLCVASGAPKVMSDCWRFNMETLQWSEVGYMASGTARARGRLDHAVAFVPLPVHVTQVDVIHTFDAEEDGGAGEGHTAGTGTCTAQNPPEETMAQADTNRGATGGPLETGPGSKAPGVVYIEQLVVFGGMDTGGSIFNDTMALHVPDAATPSSSLHSATAVVGGGEGTPHCVATGSGPVFFEAV